MWNPIYNWFQYLMWYHAEVYISFSQHHEKIVKIAIHRIYISRKWWCVKSHLCSIHAWLTLTTHHYSRLYSSSLVMSYTIVLDNSFRSRYQKLLYLLCNHKTILLWPWISNTDFKFDLGHAVFPWGSFKFINFSWDIWVQLSFLNSVDIFFKPEVMCCNFEQRKAKVVYFGL